MNTLSRPAPRAARSRRFLPLLLLLLPAPELLALEARLLRTDGRPAAGLEVSVVGRPGSVRTDKEGRFTLLPDPPLPATLVVSSDRGEIFPPLELVALPPAGQRAELVLAEAFRESVTVVGGVAPGVAASPAAATAVLGREDLDERKPQRLVDALEGVAGASRSEDGATGVPVLRGLARGRTLILLDDARVTAERRAGASATFLDPFVLGSVEIARGPGSVAYGSDAFGGVIHARPRDPVEGDPHLRWDLNQSGLADDEAAAGAEVNFDALGGAMLGEFHLREKGNSEDGDGREIHNSSARGRGGSLRWAGDTAAGRFRIGLAWDEGHDLGKPAASSTVIRASYPLEQSQRLNLGLDLPAAGGWTALEFRASLGSYRLVTERFRYAAPGVTQREDRSDVDAHDATLRFSAARPLAGGRFETGLDTSTRFGLEAIGTRQSYDADGNPTTFTTEVSIEEANRLAGGLYALWDRPINEKNSFSIGVRGDLVDTKNVGGWFGDRSTSNSSFSGHAAFTTGPFAGVTATLQVARGFRDPTLSDRYYRGISGRGFVTGNPDLEPETSRQGDATLRWTGDDGTQVALSGYLYEIDDLIERYQEGNDFYFRNRDQAEIRGLELEGAFPLPAGLVLQLAMTAIDSETKSDGRPLDGTPPFGGSLTLRWAAQDGYAWGRLNAFDDDDEAGPTEAPRPGFATVDAGVGWRFGEAIELRLIGRNLTDRHYRDSADVDAAWATGRSLSVGVLGRY